MTLGLPSPGPENNPKIAELEKVLLKRKNNRVLSLITWSNRTLVESMELGLDQLPMNWATPFAASSSGAFGVGSGKAVLPKLEQSVISAAAATTARSKVPDRG